MTAIVVASVVLGLVAVVGSRAGLARLLAHDAARDPHVYWALGLVTLLPAWLVAFVDLLGSTPGSRPPGASAAAFILSAAAGLMGAITTEARVRRAGDAVAVHQASSLWRQGVLALLPAWVIALAGHVVR